MRILKRTRYTLILSGADAFYLRHLAVFRTAICDILKEKDPNFHNDSAIELSDMLKRMYEGLEENNEPIS